MSDEKAVAWLYEINADNSARFILGQVGARPLLCVGVNSSTATPEKLDPTLQSVQRIALANGFDSFVMFNLYPQRSTVFEDLSQFADKDLAARNRQTLTEFLRQHSQKISHCWLAWGNLVRRREYLEEEKAFFLETLRRQGLSLLTAKITKCGEPCHPLYLPKDTTLLPFVRNDAG